jgi:L-asparaginase II
MLPQAGLGVAIKIDDGASRAAETAMAAILDGLGALGDGAQARALLRAPILNTRGAEVGERRAAPALTGLRIGL